MAVLPVRQLPENKAKSLMTSLAPPCLSRAALFLGTAALALAVAGCKMLPGGSDEEGIRAAPVQQGNPNAAVPFVPPLLNPNAKTAPPAAEGDARIYPGTGVFVNPAPLAAQPAAGPEEASLNFESLDVREVAKVMLGDYLRESYTVHPAVAGTVTFRTIRPIPRKDLLPTLEMLLRQNNAAIVKEEGVYKILPVAAVRGSISPQLGGSTQPLPQGFSVVVVPLKFVGAREMAKLLEPFAADNTVRVDEIRNLVIIAGHQREMRHLLDTIDLFDVDWLAGYSVGLFPVKSADVKTLVADFEKIFGAAAASPLGGIVRTIPIERMNALLVVTTQPKYLEMARTWLERFDQVGAMSGGGTRFFVYYVKNGKAENLAQLIGDLFSSRRSGPTPPTLAPGSRPAEIRSTQPGAMPGSVTPAPSSTLGAAPPSATFSIPGSTGSTSSEVRVIADKDTNSLLILSTPADYDVIESALRKLDVVPRQVMVEVMLAEVSLTDDLTFGIDWFLRGRNNGNVRGTSNLGSLPAPTPGVPAGSPATFPAGSVGNFTGLQLISTLIPGGDVRAVLRALGTDGRSKTLASPTLMALDNQKAQIKVGRRISVQTQSQTGTNTTGTVNSFQYLETGVLLSVTPRINSGGQVTLEISQEVSEPSSTPTAINPNPDVNSRSVQSTVVVASGQSIVMAGLIQEQTSRETAGIPLLSKIPILGAAFGSQTMFKQRTELVLVITPKIITDALQARDASEELRSKMPSLRDLMPSFELPAPKANRAPPPPIR